MLRLVAEFLDVANEKGKARAIDDDIEELEQDIEVFIVSLLRSIWLFLTPLPF